MCVRVHFRVRACFSMSITPPSVCVFWRVVVMCTALVAGFCGTEGQVDLVAAERGRFRMQSMPRGVQVSKLYSSNSTIRYISYDSNTYLSWGYFPFFVPRLFFLMWLCNFFPLYHVLRFRGLIGAYSRVPTRDCNVVAILFFLLLLWVFEIL